jgi:hypothetical protein
MIGVSTHKIFLPRALAPAFGFTLNMNIYTALSKKYINYIKKKLKKLKKLYTG